MALSVIFTSGIQHIAETPAGMAAQGDFVREYMRNLPGSWDDIKFIDGFPGKFVILAREKGDKWYIAGINGENSERKIRLNLSFIHHGLKGMMFTDSAGSNDMIKQEIDISNPVEITMQPCGGFVIQSL